MSRRSPSRRIVPLALLTLALVGGSACGDDGADEPARIGEPVTTVATSSTSTTAAAPATTVPPVGADTPDSAAATLYQAFTTGDRAMAAAVAEPAAVEAVFAATPGPYQPYRGCDTGEFDTSGCLYRDRSTNNTIQFDMTRRGAKWVVTGAFFSPG